MDGHDVNTMNTPVTLKTNRQFHSKNISFIGKRKIGKLRRRDVSGDGSRGGGYTFSSRTVVYFSFFRYCRKVDHRITEGLSTVVPIGEVAASFSGIDVELQMVVD